MVDPRRRLAGELLDIVDVSASFTLGPDNNEQVIQSLAAADITITLPNNLPRGFACMVKQGGAGVVIFAAAAGGTGPLNVDSFDRTAGQYSAVTLHVGSNTSKINAAWWLGGRGATA